jgi:hypothetical protein
MADELSVLAPSDDTLELSDGTRVKLLDMRARQFFKLLKIITHGPALNLILQNGASNLLSGSEQQILGKLVGYIGVALPDSFDEVVGFLYDMIEPEGLVKEDSKKAKEDNRALVQKLAQLMTNPEVEDILDLVEAIIKREAADLAALGKKVMKLLSLANKTGQLTTAPASPAPSTSEDSPEPSTESSATTEPTP